MSAADLQAYLFTRIPVHAQRMRSLRSIRPVGTPRLLLGLSLSSLRLSLRGQTFNGFTTCARRRGR